MTLDDADADSHFNSVLLPSRAPPEVPLLLARRVSLSPRRSCLLHMAHTRTLRPNVHFHCDIDFDPFLFMQKHGKTYGTSFLTRSPRSCKQSGPEWYWLDRIHNHLVWIPSYNPNSVGDCERYIPSLPPMCLHVSANAPTYFLLSHKRTRFGPANIANIQILPRNTQNI